MLRFNEIPPAIHENPKLSSEQQIKIQSLRKWLEKEAPFYGRTDEAYLLMFLNACNFDVKLSQQKITNYCEIMTKYPEWYSDRDLKSPELNSILQQRIMTLLTDQNGNQPAVSICHYSRIGNDSSKLNSTFKYLGIVMDVIARRRNCQSNGYIAIGDFSDCPGWIILKQLWPPFCKSYMQNILLRPPIRFEKLIIVNGPAILAKIISVAQSFVPNALFNKIVFCGDWSQIGQFVPLDLLPEEYGGSAGTFKQHENAFIKELMEFNEELLEDSNYDFLE